MRKTITILFILLSFSSISQEYESIIGSENYQYPNVLVITNRLADTNTNQVNPVYRNIVDSVGGIKVFKVEFKEGNFISYETSLESYFKTSPEELEDWLLFVHGDGKTFIRAAARGLDIQNYYKVNVIVFAWPSRLPEGGMTAHFNASIVNSGKSTAHLIQVYDSLKVFRENHPECFSSSNLSAMYHSLGNRVLKLAADSINEHFGDDYIFDNQILNAAAVNQEGHKDWVEKINVQKRIFNNSNVFDINLNGLRIISPLNYLLGERLFTPLSDSIMYFNFTETIGFRLPPGKSHTYFLGIADKFNGVKRYYSEIFHGLMPDTTDKSYLLKRKDGFGYNVLK
ncbi:MAG: hypothetical protein C0598_07845 [Marinilabiliales bacterium]|nr:MAG: hypothetical protein C0598_07845 [Marinilabiliales bacterium]